MPFSSLLDLLDGIAQLAERAAAIPRDEDTQVILDAFDTVIRARIRRAGRTLFPSGATQSRVVTYHDEQIYYDAAGERLTPLVPEDPSTIPLAPIEAPTAAGGGAQAGAAIRTPVPLLRPMDTGASSPETTSLASVPWSVAGPLAAHPHPR